MLLACVVFLGAVDYHPAGDAHAFGETANLAGSSFSSTARHPGQPLHLESSAVDVRPHCPMCLHRLQTAGSHLAPAHAAEVLIAVSAPSSGPALAARTTSCRPREARAPPAA
jgi:hypothetical protein